MVVEVNIPEVEAITEAQEPDLARAIVLAYDLDVPLMG